MNSDTGDTKCLSDEHLAELLDGVLNETLKPAAAQHVSLCTSCQQRAARLSDERLFREYFRAYSHQQSSTAGSQLAMLYTKLYSLGEREVGPLDGPAPSPERPVSFGRFQLREILGNGAFGIVYRAEDVQLQRQVALKLPRCSTIADPAERNRFFRESRAVAALHHPHIVPLYDAGECDGICYLASEFTAGPTLAHWMTERAMPLSADEAVQIVLALAQAVQHAHERGVLHRDIKPGNVLLDTSVPFRNLPFSPKLIDFGIAKLLDADTSETATGIVLGTPRYLAPELVAGDRENCGPAGDIYALGVVLFELLTGRAPIEASNNIEMLRRVVADEPQRLRKLRPALSRDLEAILLTCLAKKPNQRYASAQELVAELNRYLERQPTKARPLQIHERLWRWSERQPATAALIVVSFLAAAVFLGGLMIHNQQLDSVNDELTWALQRARLATNDALESDRRTAELLYVSDMRLAGRAWKEGDLRAVAQLLARHVPKNQLEDRRGFEWHFLQRLLTPSPVILSQRKQPVYDLSLSRDGRRLAAVGMDGLVQIHDLPGGNLRQSFASRQGEVNGAAFSNDGQYLATAGDDGTLRLWNLKDERQLWCQPAHNGLAFQVRFTSDNRQVISCGSDGLIRTWNTEDGSAITSLLAQQKSVESIQLSPDSRSLVSAGADGTARLWDLRAARQQLLVKSAYPKAIVKYVAFSPDGKWFATTDGNREIGLWDVNTGRLIAGAELVDVVLSLAVSADASLLVTGDFTGTIALWDLRVIASEDADSKETELHCVRQWRAHEDRIHSLLLSGDGRQLLSASADGTVKSWQVQDIASSRFLEFQPLETHQVLFAGRERLLLHGTDGQLYSHSQFDANRNIRQPLVSYCEKPIKYFSSAPTADVVAYFHEDGSLVVEQFSSGKFIRNWNMNPAEVRDICLAPEGKHLAVLFAAPANCFCVYQLDTGDCIQDGTLDSGSVANLAIAPGGNQVAFSIDDDVVLWPMNGKYPTRIRQAHERGVLHLQYSGDGSLLASTGGDRLAHVWNTGSGQRVSSFSGHRDEVSSCVFSGDKRSLLTASLDGTIKVWHLESGEELFDLHELAGGFCEVHLSPDQRWLAFRSRYGAQVTLLDLEGESADGALAAPPKPWP